MEDLCSKGVRDFSSVASVHVSETCGLPVQLSPPNSLQYPTLPSVFVQRCLTSIQGVETWSLESQCQAVAIASVLSQLMTEVQDRNRFDGGNIRPDSDPCDKSFPFLSGIPRQRLVLISLEVSSICFSSRRLCLKNTLNHFNASTYLKPNSRVSTFNCSKSTGFACRSHQNDVNVRLSRHASCCST